MACHNYQKYVYVVYHMKVYVEFISPHISLIKVSDMKKNRLFYEISTDHVLNIIAAL